MGDKSISGKNLCQNRSGMKNETSADTACNGIKTSCFQTSSAYDIGIPADNVRLGWRIITEKRGVYQTAYRCIVTDENSITVWDSGWVQSRRQTGIVPKNLKPEAIYIAKVTIRDENGCETGYGEPLSFETAPEKLNGLWLSANRLVRRVFNLDQPRENVKKARCYLSSTGIIEIRLNGSKVGGLIWEPRKGVSDKIAYYNTLDITSMLKDGKNCIGAYIGGHAYMNHDLCGMLRIEFNDGSIQTVGTDSSWQTCAASEIVKENLSRGEDIDLTKKTAWDTPEFRPDSSWENSEVIDDSGSDKINRETTDFSGGIKIVPSPSGTKVIRELKPVSCKQIRHDGSKAYILDFGVYIQGYVKMAVKGKVQDKYIIEYSELLDEEGDIWANTTAHKPVSEYTLSGCDDVFKPRFFYTGFRYICVTAPQGDKLDPSAFTACFTSDDVEQIGFFESSNDRLNQVFEIYNVSQRSNMMGNYTDCPQREKNGWTGDAAVTKASAAIMMNDWTTAEAFLDAMLMDVKPDGRPEIVVPRPSGTESGALYDITWASAIFIFPYELYMQTGDKYYIEHSIDMLLKVFDYATTYESNDLVTQNVYGDWVGLDNANGLVDGGYLSAACYYNCGMMLSRMLEIAGRDHTDHDAHMKRVYDAIQKKYYRSGFYAKESQTCISMALDFGLVPDQIFKTVLDRLIDVCNKKSRVLGTGVLGTKSLYNTLSRANEHKLLFDMTVPSEKGSFGYMIDNGATSLWEYWDVAGKNFNSNAGEFLAYFDSQNHVGRRSSVLDVPGIRRYKRGRSGLQFNQFPPGYRKRTDFC